MATHLGFYNTATTRTHVRFQFSTNAAAGGNVAPLSAFEAADIRIYKAADGAAFSNVQRSSANGITMTSPFDTLTGFHDVDIDLTDNTDAGFYASGCFYSVVLSPDTETVDGQTITGKVLAYFEIGVQPVNVAQIVGTAPTLDANSVLNVSTKYWAGTAITATSIPVATAAGASGGLFIAGTNAPVTITGSGHALTLTSTGANGAGLFSTGNGSGDGISATGGTTGNGFHGASGTGGSAGIRAECKGTNGDGFVALGFGTGDGIAATGGATGRGIHAAGGASSGAGIRAEGTAGNAAGVEFVHQGSGKDLDATTTNLVLVKGTHITGFNDIAATDVVSSGAITTSAGKVSEVILVDTLTTYTGNTPQTGDVYAAVTGATVEPTGPPASTASILSKILWLFSLGKNKRTQTSTTELVRNDADNATIGTATKSDDGTTFIRGKYV